MPQATGNSGGLCYNKMTQNNPSPVVEGTIEGGDASGGATSVCPEGYEPLTDEAECRAWADTAGRNFDLHNGYHFPHGCSIDRYGRVLFSNIENPTHLLA